MGWLFLVVEWPCLVGGGGGGGVVILSRGVAMFGRELVILSHGLGIFITFLFFHSLKNVLIERIDTINNYCCTNIFQYYVVRHTLSYRKR